MLIRKRLAPSADLDSSVDATFCHLLNDSSGSPTVLNQIISILSSQYNVQLFVGSPGSGALDNCDAPRITYFYKRSRFRIATLIMYITSQILLYVALSRSAPPPGRIIYVNTLLPFGAAVWGKINRRKVVYHIHESSINPIFLRKFLILIANKTADHVIYVSNDNLQRVNIKCSNPRILSNSIRESLMKEAVRTPYIPRVSGKFEVLMLASPRDYKGIPEFIALAARLKSSDDIAFRLVLNSDYKEAQEYLSKFSITNNLKWYSKTNDTGFLYATADLVLNLSRIDLCVETFGLTIIEAMAFGIPVIAPPAGGPMDIIIDGETGFLIDSRDTNKLLEKLTYLAEHPQCAIKMSMAARQRSLSYTEESYADSLRALFESF